MIGPFSTTYRSDFATFMKATRQAKAGAFLNTPKGEAKRQRLNAETVKRMRETNHTLPNCDCDGSGPHSGDDVRLLPMGGGSNAILCRACWDYEIEYRREISKGSSLQQFCQFPKWEDGKVYEG